MVYNKLPQGWVECELKDLLDLQNGYAFSSKDYVKFSNTLNIRMSNIRPNGIFDEDHNIKYLPDEYAEKYKDYLLKDGDLIIAMTDMADNSKILGVPTVVKHNDNKNFLMNQRVGKLIQTSDQGYIPFIKYLLISPKVRDVYKRKGKGGLQLNLSKNDILNIKIAIPTLDVQKQIVDKIEEEFGKIDEGVEKLKLAQEQIKQYRQSVLKSAFEGKLYKTTEWEEKTLEEITSILGDGLHGTPKYSENGEYYFINGNNLNDGKILIKDDTKKVDEEEYQKHKKDLNENTVFVSINGTLGNTAFYNNEKIILGKSACYFNLLPIANKKFIRFLLKTNNFINYANLNATGSTIKNVSLKSMRAYKVNLPTLDEQKQIVKEIEKRFEVADEVERVIAENLEKAEQLKQSILKKAFEGRLVPQDPTDELASVLLQKIKSERSK